MTKMKLMTIVGTRPEIIKMSEIIKRCDECFDHVLVHTGQNYDYELNQVFFDNLGLREPDYYLGVVGNDLGETIGNVISKSYKLLSKVRPDALIVLGDTNSCLCVISAKRLKIPVFHMEAGNRCFDENLPEEVNRRIVDISSDVNLCYSEHARRNLLAMSCDPARTFVVGSPMNEVLSVHRESIESSNVLGRLGLEKGRYIVLSAHREENIDNEKNFKEMASAIDALAEEFGFPVLYSMHPRSRKRFEDSGMPLHPSVRTHKPFGFFDYIQLQQNAFCVVSDSGTLAEESSILRFPAVSLRTSTERQEAFDGGALVLGSLSSTRIVESVRVAVHLHEEGARTSGVNCYQDGGTSTKVTAIIQSFTPYVDSRVWRK